MMALKHWATLAAVLTGLSLVLQTISFIIPGWLMVENLEISFNMAVWYLIVCEVKSNVTLKETTCDTLTYKRLFDEKSGNIVSLLRMNYPAIISAQAKVTCSYILTLVAFWLLIYQLKTFHSQTPGLPCIYDNEPPDTCNIRARFLCSGGLAGLFQIFAGPLLGMVVYDFVHAYRGSGHPLPPFPFSLVIVGLAAGVAVISAVIELLIAFRTRESPRRPHLEVHCQDLEVQMVDLLSGHDKKGHLPHKAPSLDDAEYNGDYYGRDYDVNNPTFHSQGHRHDNSSGLFPGYRLGRQNLQGHDQKWWRKVTFASMPFK